MLAALTIREPYDPAMRGYHIIYRRHETNHCPGCGRTSWLVGRVMAECAFCATAIPLADTQQHPGEKSMRPDGAAVATNRIGTSRRPTNQRG